jgi:cobalt-zinc-cadmium efflux system outer membrane protein
MRSFLVAISLALCAPAFAQDSRAPLTLSVALTEALAHNPELVALRREHDVAEAAPEQERFLMPPMLEAQIWQWPVTTLNPANVDSYMLMAQQQLPGRGKRNARARVAEREADVAGRAVDVRANEVLDRVKQAWADLALARETLAIYEREIPILRDIADAAALRYASGHVGQHDTMKAVVELSRLHEDLITWRERARMAEVQLNTILGRQAGLPVEPLAPRAASAIPAAADAERLALERHPELAMATAEIAREEAELERVRGERKPDFVVGGGYMLMPGEAGAWTARAGMTWPNAPWSRGRLNAEITTQEKRVAAARARRDVVASGVKRMVREAIVRVQSARERADLLRTSILPQAEHTFDLARIGYQASRGEFLELVDNERTLLGVRVDAAAARIDVERALADLERAIGLPCDPSAGQLVAEGR